MTHDPLCPTLPEYRMPNAKTCLWCDVIARVRADERERIAQDIEAQHEAAGDECYRPGMGALMWLACTHFEDAAIARGGESDG